MSQAIRWEMSKRQKMIKQHSTFERTCGVRATWHIVKFIICFDLICRWHTMPYDIAKALEPHIFPIRFELTQKSKGTKWVCAWWRTHSMKLQNRCMAVPTYIVLQKNKLDLIQSFPKKSWFSCFGRANLISWIGTAHGGRATHYLLSNGDLPTIKATRFSRFNYKLAARLCDSAGSAKPTMGEQKWRNCVHNRENNAIDASTHRSVLLCAWYFAMMTLACVSLCVRSVSR